MKRGSAAGTRLRFPIKPLRSCHRGMDRAAKRDYVLTSEYSSRCNVIYDHFTLIGSVIAAKEIKRSPSRPKFYVVTSCDGKPRLRTQERQDASPTWSDPRPLFAFPSSMPIPLNATLSWSTDQPYLVLYSLSTSSFVIRCCLTPLSVLLRSL